MTLDVYVAEGSTGAADEPIAFADLDALREEWPGGGTYALGLELPRPVSIEVGALGEREFPAGGYAYVGSALGAGGFSRVARHAEIAAGERAVRHWHVDYLTGHPDSRLRAVVLAPGAEVECATARALAAEAVPGFGASDCECPSHLADRDSWTASLTAAEEALSRVVS
jgi:endonuclease-3